MNVFAMFREQIPELRRQAAHLSWPLKLRFWIISFVMSARIAKEERERAALPRTGDPARRGECCDMRPNSYGRHQTVNDIPELKDVLQTRGTGLLGWIQYFQCKVCGQEWMEDWHQEKFGGDYEVKKI